MSFVDGVVGICHSCGGEINYAKHVAGFQVLPTGVRYRARHSCGVVIELQGTRREHRVITSWLRWAHLGESEREYSEEEELIRQMAKELSKINDDRDIIAAFGQ